MISQITKIKNFGSFKDFSWDDKKLNDFQKINLLYGFNGTGKTNLSRLLYFLNNGGIPDNQSEFFTGNIEFDVCYGGQHITSFSENNNCLGKIAVFNKNFITDNLEFSTAKGSSGKKIQYFDAGKKRKETKNELEKAQKHAKRAKELHVKVENKRKECDGNHKKIEEEFQEKITEFLGTSKSMYNVKKASCFLQNNLSKNSSAPLSETDLNKAKATYSDVEKEKILFEYDFYSYFLSEESIKKIKILLNTKIQRQAKTDIKDEIIEWIAKGKEWQSSTGTCLFCSQSFPEGYWKKRLTDIEAIIKKDDDYIKKENELAECISQIEKKLSNDIVIMQRETDFYCNFVDDFKTNNDNLQKQHKAYSEILKKVLTKLKEKQANKSMLYDIESASNEEASLYEQICDAFKASQTAFDALKNTYIKNNENTSTLKKSKESALEQIEKHFAPCFIKKLQKNTDIQKTMDKRLETLNYINSECEKAVIHLKTELANEQAPIKEINNVLRKITGMEKFKFEYVETEDSYKILRVIDKEQAVSAINLSEGEKNIIAFSYFMALIKEKIEKESIIVIDDPISSLDNIYFHNIKRLILNDIFNNEKLAQLFILTHNFYFFRQIRLNRIGKVVCKNLKCKNTANEDLRNNQIYLVEKNTSDGSSIVKPSSYLLKFTNEYLTLIESLRQYKEQISESNFDYEVALMQLNSIRRIIEVFLDFKYPGTTLTKAFKESIKDTNLTSSSILDILQEGSHLTSNSFPSLDHSSFESIKRLIDDVFQYFETIDKPYYDSVFIRDLTSSDS